MTTPTPDTIMPTIPTTSGEALALASTFPVLVPYLAHLEVEKRWTVRDFDELLAAKGGTGAKRAAAFVLHLLDPHRRWKAGAFVLRDALVSWDHEQTAAFVQWVSGTLEVDRDPPPPGPRFATALEELCEHANQIADELADIRTRLEGST